MKLSTLRYFVAVAQDLSFTKASEKLYVSQPSLSRHIKSLEQELGTKLFVRHGHCLSLTSDGERFLSAAIETLNKFDQLSNMFKAKTDAKQTAEVIRIGYPIEFNRTKLTQKLEKCKEKFPNLQFIVSTDTPLKLNEKWQNDELDLLINLETYIPEKVPYQATFLKNHLKIIVSKQNPLSHQSKLAMSELKDESVVLLERKVSPFIVDYVIGQALACGFHFDVKKYVSTLTEGLSQVSLNNQQISFIYSTMTDKSLEEQYQVNFIDLDSPDNHQDLVLVAQKLESRTLKNIFEILAN